MKNNSGAVVLTEGSVWKKMLAFTLPIFIGNLFQQLYHTADSLIVGRVLGKEALAAVGSTGSLIFLFVGFFNGLGVGAGVVVSRYFGAKQWQDMKKTIHTAVALGLAGGIFLTVVGVLMANVFLSWMRTPEDVIDTATVYLRIYFCGTLAQVVYNITAGILQAVGDSRHPLYYLIISSVVNVILDIILVKAFENGVGAAALATIISQFLSMGMCGYRLLKKSPPEYTVYPKEIRFDRPSLRMILKNGVPSGIQMSFNSLANVVVQSYINIFGSSVVAGVSAMHSIEGFAFLPVNSISMTMATFVSQNIGARNYDRVKKGARIGVITGPVISELIGIILFIWMPFFIGVFDSDPDVIAAGTAYGNIKAPMFLLCAFTHCIAGVLRGAGRADIPMYAILGFWGIVRVGYIVIATSVLPKPEVVFAAYPITWTLSTAMLLIVFFKADWVHGFSGKRKKAAATEGKNS